MYKYNKKEARLHRKLMPLFVAAANILGKAWQEELAENLNIYPWKIDWMWQGEAVIYYEDVLKIEQYLLERYKKCHKAFNEYFGEDIKITEAAEDFLQLSFENNMCFNLRDRWAVSTYEPVEDFGIEGFGGCLTRNEHSMRYLFEEVGWTKR